MSAAVSTVCVLGLWLIVRPLSPPTDREMIENLAAHRVEFERLIVMIREDPKLERVDEDWTRPEEPASIGVPRERIAEYRRLCRAAGIPRGFYSFDGGETIEFIAYAAGLSVSGSAKSYVVSKQRPHGLLIDGPLEDDEHEGKVALVRDLGGGWYLVFTST